MLLAAGLLLHYYRCLALGYCGRSEVGVAPAVELEGGIVIGV
jgi:hypothetical protein